MPEILTESFCERCGTRYTFESSKPRAARLKGFKVMSRGLKNFVMSDDTSMDEAFAAARSETDREVTSQQLDAFHKTFNFCMSCRQYTCGNCWNEAEGRCLSCAPHLGQEILPAPFPGLDATAGIVVADGANGVGADHNGHEPVDTLEAWPSADLARTEPVDAIGSDLAWPNEAALAAAAAMEVADIPAADDVPVAADADAPDDAIDASDVAIAGAAAVLARTDADDAVATSDVEAEAVEATPTAEVVATDEAVADVGPVVAEAAIAEAAVADVVVAEAADADVDAAADMDELPPAVEAIPDASAAATAEPSEPDRPAVPSPAAIDPADVPGRADAAAAQTSDLFRRFRPGQSLDDEIAAYERDHDLADVATVAAAAAATDALADAADPGADDPTLDVAAAAAAGSPPDATADTEADERGRAAAAAAAALAAGAAAQRQADDVVAQPTWRIVAPDGGTTSDGVAEAPAPPIAASAEPAWPAQPQWPAQRPAAGGLPFLDRPPVVTGGIEQLWAESAREVAAVPEQPGRATGGVQPCVSCGLSLSATARFCRRCGSRQG